MGANNTTQKQNIVEDQIRGVSAINSATLLASVRSPLLSEGQRSKKRAPSRLQKQLETHKRQRNNKKWIHEVYFTPQSKFIIIFQLIKLFLIYLYFLQIPITIAFQKHRREEESQKLFEQINIPAITFLIVGIGIKLKTAFYKQGVLIWDQKKILMHYLIYSFVLDFLSITSIIVYQFAEILNQSHSHPLNYRFIVLLFFLKIPEVVTIQKSLILSFDLNRRIKATIKLLLLLLKIFMLSNAAACGFFYLSDAFCQSDPRQDFKSCWIDHLQIRGVPLRQSDDWALQYSCSLYWASTTMLSIGYGDVTPLNGAQIIYAIIIQFFSCIIFAFCINEVWDIVQQKNTKKKKIHRRVNVMNVYMRDKNVGVGLKSRVNAYLSHFYHTKNLREKDLQNQIINELTPSLKKELFYQSYGFIFQSHTFFSDFSLQFLEDASCMIDQVGYFQEQYLYEPEQQLYTYPLYYVQKGQLQKKIILGNSSVENINLQLIDIGKMIGLRQFITQTNYSSSVMALKYSLIYKMNYQKWNKCLKVWQQDFEIYHTKKHKILYDHNYHKLDFKCFICQKKGHLSEDCIDINIRSNLPQIIRKYLQVQNRGPFLRNKLRSSLSISASLNAKNFNKIKFNKNYSQQQIQHNYQHLRHNSPKKDHHKKSVFQKMPHTQKMNKILERKKYKQSVWTQSESSEEDIIGSTLEIDKVQNYEIYFPNMNSSLDLARQRKRTTNLHEIFKL